MLYPEIPSIQNFLTLVNITLAITLKQRFSMSDSVSSSAQDDDTSMSLYDLRRRTGKPLLYSIVDI